MPQIHPRVTRAVPPRLGSGRGDLPDDTAYTVARIPERDVSVGRGIAGRRGRRGLVLFEGLVQRDVERSARLIARRNLKSAKSRRQSTGRGYINSDGEWVPSPRRHTH
jgi:hypothetical protein